MAECFDIAEELKKLPDKPGVYLMKDDTDEIIYVGKAINLKNRVRQYFQSNKNHTAKVLAMVPRIREFEYIVTDSEMEALILECNYIKNLRPKYNVMLKDDKMYPYIKVTIQEDFPRIFMTRHLTGDKARYFGPITDAYAVKETIDTIHKIWPIRKCKKVFPRDMGKERPCLNYHIGQCMGVCDGLISKEEYRTYIEEAMQLLEGKQEKTERQLEEEMYLASEQMAFEKAAQLRDKLRALRSIVQKQKMANNGLGDMDVIAFARAHGEGIAQVFFIRAGKMTGREHFSLRVVDEMSRSEVMTEFVEQFYSGTAYVPKEILLQEPLLEEEQGLLETYLSGQRGAKVIFTVPQKGEKQKLVTLAWKNAMITFEQRGERIKREEQRTKGAVEELRQILQLEQEIHRIESYDISNTQGFESVGAMVVFEEGKAKRSDYRKFKIRDVVGANDFASMQEVLARRFRHGKEEQAELDVGEIGKFNRLPDLILMDGGKPQVLAAERVMRAFGISIPVCGMVKDERHRTRGLLFEGVEVPLSTHSQGFQLVTRMQDEVHRFAITYHRSLRDKKGMRSVLDDINGVGAVRRKALLRQFGSAEEVSKASVLELLEVSEINEKVAQDIYTFFHKKTTEER